MNFLKLSFATVLMATILTGCGGSSDTTADGDGRSDGEDSLQTDNSLEDNSSQDAVDDSGETESEIPEGNDATGTNPDIDDNGSVDGGVNPPEAEDSQINSPTRAAEWQSAFSVPPSSDLANRELLLDTIFKLHRYEFVLELANDVSALGSRILNGDAAFTRVNVAEGGYDVSYLCKDGGRVLMVSGSLVGKAGNLLFDSCKFDDNTINGLSNIGVTNDTDRFENPQRVVNANIGVTYVQGGLVRSFSGLLLQTETRYSEESDFSSTLSGSYTEAAAGVADSEFVVSYNLHLQVFAVARDGLDEEDIGMALLSNISVVPQPNAERWSIFETTRTYLRGTGSDGRLESGQLTIKSDNQTGAKLVLQTGNGDPSTFDLYGFSSTTDVNSRVYSWGGEKVFSLPGKFDPL